MKVTFITGASSGLGYSLARLYAKDNNNLLLVSSNENTLNDAACKIQEEFNNIKVDHYACDLSNIDECKKLYNYTKEKGYFINNVVNNAGIGDRTDFKDMDIDLQLKLNHINIDALLYFTRVFIDDMIKNNEGHIINVSSIAGFTPGCYMATYHASKAYVVNLGISLARELKKTGVKIFTICPGPFESKFKDKAHNYSVFKGKVPTSDMVAEYTYKCSLKGKWLKVYGLKNKFVCFMVRLLPFRLVANASVKEILGHKD